MRVERDWLRNLIFGGDQARRFTQDSPILPDVWLVGGLYYCADPAARVDLLLTPFQKAPPSEVATLVRQRLDRLYEYIPPVVGPDSVVPDEDIIWSGGRAERRVVLRKYSTLAVNQTNVVAALSLEELIVTVLPLTPWWRRNVTKAPPEPKSVDSDARAAARHIHHDPKRIEQEVAWLTRVVGVLVLCGQEPTRDGDLARDDDAPAWMSMDEARRLRRATRADAKRFAAIVADVGAQKREFERLVSLSRPKLDGGQTPTLVWSVTLNREASVSISRSVPATKADAARRVFELQCSKLCWAVVDSGIDATHPALQDPQGEWRVDSTYDFTHLRGLVCLDANPTTAPIATHGENTDTEVIDRQVKRLREGLKSGRYLDWGTLMPLLRIVPTQYRLPENDHGTHVAGIIGARRTCQDPDAGEGLCPDIRFCDVRVLDAQGRGDEFSVIAALQFIRYLNANSDRMVIHGVNLSLSLLHDVENYACGRTPVCDECERLVSSGVVVVVAAGNRGYERVLTPLGELDAYRSISITDPGNTEAVITVGSTHRFEPHTYGVSYFSSRGPTGDGRIKPDILAPGEKIESTLPGGVYGVKDGTSMAAPHVSGVAALLMARHTEFQGQPARVKKILCASATDLGREKYFQGAGMIDALRALQSA
jgi:hypothetical protein